MANESEINSKAKSSGGGGQVAAAGVGAATQAIGEVTSDLLRRRQEAQALRIKHEEQLREAMLQSKVLPVDTLQRGSANANESIVNNLPNLGRR